MAGEDQGMLRARARQLLSPLAMAHFRRLWIADMISLLGDWAGRLALTVLVLERTGSPGWAAAVTAVSLAGFVGLGQVLATLADKHGRIAVMLTADVARAALFAAMLLDIPVGALLVLAFLAGLATPPFEAARSAALPDLVPEDRYLDSLALAGISVQASLVVGYALGGLLLTAVDVRTAIAINAASFIVSAILLLKLRHTDAALPAAVPSTVGRSLGDGAASLFGDRMVRRSLVLVSVTGALGTVDEALVVPYAEHISVSDGFLGILAASIPIGTLIATAIIATSSRDHHTLLRNAGWCALITSALSAPMFWLGASGPFAFLAFGVAGGMFAVSIPTNTVIGMRLHRDSRASAMGIAVGVLMGSQALGAALGGVAANIVGPPRAIGGALALCAAFGLWTVVTTPTEAKHLVRRWVPSTADRPAAGHALVERAAVDRPERSVVDLVALEADQPPAGVM